MLEYRYKAYEPGVKEQVVDMAINGSGIRDTSRVLGISKSTVINTLKRKENGLVQINPNIQTMVTVGMAVTRHPLRSSQPREPPPQLLTEPYLNLSAHTALLTQPLTHNPIASVPLTTEPFWPPSPNSGKLAISCPSISCICP